MNRKKKRDPNRRNPKFRFVTVGTDGLHRPTTATPGKNNAGHVLGVKLGKLDPSVYEDLDIGVPPKHQ